MMGPPTPDPYYEGRVGVASGPGVVTGYRQESTSAFMRSPEAAGLLSDVRASLDFSGAASGRDVTQSGAGACGPEPLPSFLVLPRTRGAVVSVAVEGARGGANPAAPAARGLGNCRGKGDIAPVVNRG